MRTRMNKPALLLSLLALGALGLVGAGCGDDDDEDTAATEATTTEEAAGGGGGDAEVSMTEYAFDPADATVGPGQTITATNDAPPQLHDQVRRPGGIDERNPRPRRKRRTRCARKAGRVRRALHDPRPRREGHEGHADGRIGPRFGRAVLI
jgi:hypothetical protein